ncbi:MAG: SGNH/GDSL hydrolase family protein [Spirulinaceae cyanobacterium]
MINVKVQILLIIVAIGVCLVAIAEVGLRLLFGFGNPPLYIADEEIGYLLAPKQKLRRMGNYIEINDYSMRSGEVTAKPSQNTRRLLLLGDSVANGGWWTDQKKTISALIREQLASVATNQEIEVLNASANSWGPRNQLAYVQKLGTYESQVLILLINTDDLFATAPTSLPVGRDRNYPNQKPPLALVEVYNRYFISPQPIPGMKEIQKEGGDRVGFNLEAIAKIKSFSNEKGARFVLAMTPLLRELGESGPRDYEVKARERLLEFTKSQNIEYINFLTPFNQADSPKSLYRDHIHLSVAGNQLVSEVISQKMSAD